MFECLLWAWARWIRIKLCICANENTAHWAKLCERCLNKQICAAPYASTVIIIATQTNGLYNWIKRSDCTQSTTNQNLETMLLCKLLLFHTFFPFNFFILIIITRKIWFEFKVNTWRGKCMKVAKSIEITQLHSKQTT